MSPAPHKPAANGVRVEITDPDCGRVAMDNLNRYFWQSRMTRAGAPAPLPDLTDLEQLARDVRRGWSEGERP